MSRFRVVILIVGIALVAGLIPMIIRDAYSGYFGNSTHNGKGQVPVAAGSPVGATAPRASRPKPGTGKQRGSHRTPGSTTLDGAGNPHSSSGSSPNPSRSASPTPTESPTPTDGELAQALLTTADLPGSGYSAEPSQSGGSLNSLATECPELNDGPNPEAQAAASFTGGNYGPDISETLLQYSTSAAEAQISLFTEVAQTCNNLTFTADKLTFSVAITTESSPGLGDQSVELQINATLTADPSIVIGGDLVAVRHGGTVIVITNVGLPLETSVTPLVVSRAYTKAAALW